jgi:hypothetical protein
MIIMSKHDSAFGGQWDAGQFLTEQLISYPISHMIRQDAERAGIDLSNPVRSVVSLMASGLMSTLWGSFLGPFGAILGGLMGETLGLAASYPGDRTKQERIREREALVALKVKAMVTALGITKEHVSRRTWDSFVDNYHQRLASIADREVTKAEAFLVGERIILDSIRRVGSDVY